tara:strand:- start:576 stop:1028 length:453 start_codon:yes stop_codon:yes gene_type:complete
MKKFEYLSGDFVAAYNETMKNLKKEQEILDQKYSSIIENIVEKETARLEEIVPHEFKTGDKVKDFNGNQGLVVSTKVVINVQEDEEYSGKLYGPNLFFPIENSIDEKIVTCEGLIRMFDVDFESSELEKDWMIEKRTKRCYSDELTLIEN